MVLDGAALCWHVHARSDTAAATARHMSPCSRPLPWGKPGPLGPSTTVSLAAAAVQAAGGHVANAVAQWHVVGDGCARHCHCDTGTIADGDESYASSEERALFLLISYQDYRMLGKNVQTCTVRAYAAHMRLCVRLRVSRVDKTTRRC